MESAPTHQSINRDIDDEAEIQSDFFITAAGTDIDSKKDLFSPTIRSQTSETQFESI